MSNSQSMSTAQSTATATDTPTSQDVQTMAHIRSQIPDIQLARTTPSSPSPATPVTPTGNNKAGRHSKFTPDQDVAIVREVAASEAHIAPYGETRKRFEKAASMLNNNPLFSTKLTWTQVQDRYKRLQDQYDAFDKDNQRFSGVSGGEMGQLAGLLMSMREARDDMNNNKDASKAEEQMKEEEKERVGVELVAAGTSRRRGMNDDSNGESDYDDVNSINSRRKKRRTGQSIGGIQSEIDRFGEHMKEADLARVEFEKYRLDFERDQYTKDCEDRLKEREERRLERKEEHRKSRSEREENRRERHEEREEASRIELEKFKLTINAFISKK